MKHGLSGRSWRRRSRTATAMVVASLLAVTSGAHAQADAIRKARDAVRDRTQSLDALFGKEKPLTTSIEDARDGVPSLDGFQPQSYSPMGEMPRGQDGTILLTPGAYTMTSEAYCLMPGTLGPQTGDGYLHAEWKGPKSDLLKKILQRRWEHAEIPRPDIQLLLWAMLTRADMTKLAPEAKTAATKLLTREELLDLAGYKLGVVPDAVRQRVLQSAPPPVREVLEAENEMRRMFASADAQYADMERVAVRTGAAPEGAAEFIVPKGRWSYHPNGFFIRYLPEVYHLVRIDIYYPEKFEIHRDASGRIISVTTPDGRKLETAATLSTSRRQFAVRPVAYAMPADRESGARTARAARHAGIAAATRLELLDAAMRGGAANARTALLALAHADYADLVDLADAMNAASSAERRFIREAVHSALARYLGLARHHAIARGSLLERSLRPARTPRGFRYVIAPVPITEWSTPQASGMGASFPPSKGGANGAARQRLGVSGQPSPYGSPRPGVMPNNAMNTLRSAANGVGTAASTYKMVGVGMKQALDKTDIISANLGGNPPDAAAALHGEIESWHRSLVVRRSSEHPVLMSVAWNPRRTPERRRPPGIRRQGVPDYQILSKPTTITFPPVLPDANTSADHARTLNTLLDATFRMATALEAAAMAQTRLAAAVKARDTDWQWKQGQAMVYAKRSAGVAMVEVTTALEGLRTALGPELQITENQLRAGQRELAANGFSAPVASVMTQFGWSEARREAYRRDALAQDPGATAYRLGQTFDNLQAALKEYGAHLALLPDVSPPWN